MQKLDDIEVMLESLYKLEKKVSSCGQKGDMFFVKNNITFWALFIAQ